MIPNDILDVIIYYKFAQFIFVYCGSNFDLIAVLIHVLIALEMVGVCPSPIHRLTTYLTIDSLGAHGNNGYKTAKE